MDKHVLLRMSLLSEQYCTAGTKEELAQHILTNMAVAGSHITERYTVADVMERLSEPVQCAEDQTRKHYLHDAGAYSYAP